MNLAERAELLDAIYAELPSLDCQGRCSSSCGPVPAFPVEQMRILLAHGSTPSITAWRCPLLVKERCRAHVIRPMLCRLWGVVETMRCPWGCEPSRWLTAEQGYEFLERVENIEKGIGA